MKKNRTHVSYIGITETVKETDASTVSIVSLLKATELADKYHLDYPSNPKQSLKHSISECPCVFKSFWKRKGSRDSLKLSIDRTLLNLSAANQNRRRIHSSSEISVFLLTSIPHQKHRCFSF